MKKAHGTKSKGNQVQTSKSFLPVESHRTCLVLPALHCDNLGMLSTKKVHQRPSVQCFYWLLTEALFSYLYQNSRLPEGTQMFSVPCIVCTDSLGTVSYTYQFWEWWDPSQNLYSRSSQGPAWHIGLYKDRQSQTCSANSFPHMCIQVDPLSLNLVAWHC